MAYQRKTVDRRGGNQRIDPRPTGELRARIDALRAIPMARRTAAEADELQRLDLIHYHRMLRLPKTIARLRAQLATLEALAR